MHPPRCVHYAPLIVCTMHPHVVFTMHPSLIALFTPQADTALRSVGCTPSLRLKGYQVAGVSWLRLLHMFVTL